MTKLKFSVLVVCLFAFAQMNAQDTKREKPTPAERFANLDTNKDGVLNLEEFSAQKGKKETTAEDQAERFAKMDTDTSGSISQEEFLAAGKADKKGKKGNGRKRRK